MPEEKDKTPGISTAKIGGSDYIVLHGDHPTNKAMEGMLDAIKGFAEQNRGQFTTEEFVTLVQHGLVMIYISQYKQEGDDEFVKQTRDLIRAYRVLRDPSEDRMKPQ